MSLQKQNQEILQYSDNQHVPITFVLDACSLKQWTLIPNVFDPLINASVLWIRGVLCHRIYSF